MERLKAQANQVWQLLTSAQTYGTYRNAITITWNLLREAGILLGLCFFLFVVVFNWYYTTATPAGRNFRVWFDNLGSGDQVANEASKALLAAGKTSLDYTLTTAKTQLGLPVEKTK